MDAGRGRELEAKVYAGERLDRADGEALYDSDDLVWLGRLAHHRRTGEHGDRVLFGVERHLDVTDRDSAEETVAEAVRQVGELPDGEVVHLRLDVAAPTRSWERHLRVLRGLREALPAVRVTGVSAVDLHRFERATGRPADELLDELVAAGLDALTGGGAEIFDPEVRRHLVGADGGWADWSGIHRLAHGRGLRTPATMRYGHVEEPRHRVDHLLRLRELQDDTGGFDVFVPLRHRPDSGGAPVAPVESLKNFAVSRLLLDNVPHLRALRGTYGPVAQLALNFGVDDLAETAVEDPPAERGAPEPAPVATRREELVELIWDAGFRPVERDARYAVVREYDAPPSLAQRRAEPQRVWA
ncbi:aminofutalosine synthase MqnE [Plantactinospora sp. CA-290183]|uniref:aminofutalosine synthase MqnE n=1 Tax=Plantactinospora sp. CA-290183 TaxID=3240006 RepID=UPI003D9028E0